MLQFFLHFKLLFRSGIRSVVLLLLIFLLPLGAFAQGNGNGNGGGGGNGNGGGSGSSSVAVIPGFDMSFARLVKPSGTGTVTVSKDGLLTSNNVQLLNSTGAGATLTIQIRKPKNDYMVSFVNGASAGQPSFTAFAGSYSCPTSCNPLQGNFNVTSGNGFMLDVAKNTDVDVSLSYGATLSVNSTVNFGQQGISYTILVEEVIQ